MNKTASARLITAFAGGLLLALPAGAATAQTITSPYTGAVPSPYTDISPLTDISAYLLSSSAQAPAVQGSNSTTIIQSGSNNTATADMTVPSSVTGGTGSYFGNVTLQAQVGVNNTSNLQAVGNSNVLVTTQVGSDNSTSITADGSNNTFSSTQVGSGLSYTLQRVGNGQSISVLQKN
jgi:hypothetical protein